MWLILAMGSLTLILLATVLFILFRQVLKGEKMLKDFNKAIEKGNELLKGLVTDYAKQIEEAYRKVGDEKFKVNLSLEFKPDGNRTKVEADISFVESKVKDSAVGFVSDQQTLKM